jgi:hypothetical protein
MKPEDMQIMVMMPDSSIHPISFSEFLSICNSSMQTERKIDDAYTIDETAKILKLKSNKSVYNLRKKGKITGFGQGQGTRITGESLRNYMKSKNK